MAFQSEMVRVKSKDGITKPCSRQCTRCLFCGLAVALLYRKTAPAYTAAEGSVRIKYTEASQSTVSAVSYFLRVFLVTLLVIVCTPIEPRVVQYLYGVLFMALQI